MKKITQHLLESEMTYTAHLKHSVKQSNRLIVIALKSYLHGLIPSIFASAGPLGIYRIYKEIKRHHHVQRIFKHDDN